MNRKAIITQARMSSTRLPGKVLMKIKGITLLEYHVERARKAGIPIIVATSIESTDDVIVRLCEKKGYLVFRGSLKNVLSRYYECARQYNVKEVVRITSDCPLIDGSLIASALKDFNSQRTDYASNTLNRTYPRGFDFEICSFSALKYVYEHAQDDYEREHVMPYIWKSHPEKFRILSLKQVTDKSKYHLAVDTENDLELLKVLIEKHSAHTKNCADITKILDAHPKLSNINIQMKRKMY